MLQKQGSRSYIIVLSIVNPAKGQILSIQAVNCSNMYIICTHGKQKFGQLSITRALRGREALRMLASVSIT